MKLKSTALALLSVFIISVISMPAQSGPEVPFPLTVELPFPWGGIQGIWIAKDKDLYMLFSFEVLSNENGQKILQVDQLDPNMDVILATGQGVAVDGSNVIHAGMTGRDGQYFLTVGEYTFTDVDGRPNNITVFSIRPFARTQEPSVDMIVSKVSDDPYSAYKKMKKTVPQK